MTQIIERAETHFRQGEQHLVEQRIGETRAEFDKAVDTVLESGMDVRANPRLQTYYRQLVELKTKRSRRLLPPPKVIASTLRKHRVQQLKGKMLAGERWQENGLIFTTSVGTPLTPRNVLRSFHWLLAEAKIPRRGVHNLRHSCASLLLRQNVPVCDYLDKWLTTVARPRLRERTLSDYADMLDRYVRPSIGQKRLADARPLDIQTFYGQMQGRGLSARTVRYTHAILSSAFKQAIKWNMLARNPCEAVELPRAERREMQAFSPEEAGRFLKAAAEDEHGIIFAFALATGMRPEEYLALKWSDIELDRDVAIVRRALVRRKGGGWYFDEPKTSRSRRTVPLPVSIVKALITHRSRQAETRLKAGILYQNNELVFATGEGTPHNSRNLAQRHLLPILKRAKLSVKFRLYDLRHSCATLLLAVGENPKVVSERLGHASIVLTLDTYSHVLPSMQQAATEKLEKLLYSR